MKLNLVCCWKVERQGGGEDTSKAVELLKEALQIAESRCGGWFRTTVPFFISTFCVSPCSFGADSEQVAEVLAAQATAGDGEEAEKREQKRGEGRVA